MLLRCRNAAGSLRCRVTPSSKASVSRVVHQASLSLHMRALKQHQRRKVLRVLREAVECIFHDAFSFEQGKSILRRITGTTRWLAMDADLAAMQVVLESLAVRKQMCGSNLTSLAPFYFFSFCQAAQSTAGRVQSWTQNYKKGFRCRISTSHATLLCSQSFVRRSPFQAKVSRFASYF